MSDLLLFIGSGSAFGSYKNNWQSNVVFQRNGRNLLIDCGSDIRHACEDAGLKAADIHGVFLTHFHADHIGGLEWLAFLNYFPRVFNPKHTYTKLLVRDEKFLQWVWGSIRNGVQSVEYKTTDIDTFFDSSITGDSFWWEGLCFNVIQTIHTMNGNTLNPSYGLRFNLNGRNAFFSGDTQFNPAQYIQILRQADIIFHDCETSPFESGVHSHWKKMLDIAPEIKRKMFLYHYDQRPFDAKKEGFAGWVEKGQSFDGSEIKTGKTEVYVA